jgi:putative acetyltransferase
MISIRREEPGDVTAVRRINELAFGQPQEAAIVDRIRARCDNVLSLVAVDGDEVVGHILFSPATIERPEGRVDGMGLAPMAVLPDRQRQGIGSALVQDGLKRLAEQGCPFVVVLGHAGYYPRFGFEPASRRDLQCQWDGIPDEAFMVAMLDDKVMTGVDGVIRYRPEFDEEMTGDDEEA